MERFENNFKRHVTGDDDDDWGSDFEELCSQEIEDNKINEIREANLFKISPRNFQVLTEDASQLVEKTGNRCANSSKTGAIPKLGFSYLNNIINVDDNTSFQVTRKQAGNNAHPQRQVSQPAIPSGNGSMNTDNNERQLQIQVSSDNDVVEKQTPRKLKPEAFSFLNKLPQKNDNENVSIDRKTLVPTVFSHAEKLGISHSQDDTNLTHNESLDMSDNPIPSAPPLDNTTNNYESIMEESFPEFDLPSASKTIDEENQPQIKPPLPIRPPPVFKYPPETFSSSRSTSVESTSNQTIPQPLPQPAVTYPKLGHSISAPDSDINRATKEKILISKAKNRKSLPSMTKAFPVAPKRPLPPLPISNTENVRRIESQAGIIKLESPGSANDEKWLEEAPTIPGTMSTHNTNQLSNGVEATQHTAFNEPVSEQQLISNSQHRLAQILTNQTSVDNAVFISQQKIASAIASRAIGFQSSSIPRLNKTEESQSENGGRPKECRVIPRRSTENYSEQTNEDESERQASYLEAKEAVNPRRFTDHDTLISAMNRPALPQKAAPIQRSVSCNSLVQSIKELSFSVWSKPEKKRNSDLVGFNKKNVRSTPVTSSPKVKPAAPLHIASIPTDIPSEANNSYQGKNEPPFIDQKSILQDCPWYHDVDAKEGQLRLLSVGQDGTFLIRPSSRPTEDIQNTMCIYYNGKVRNLHIRKTPDGRYVLGTKNNKTFSSLPELIKHHKEIPVEIVPQGSTPLKPQMYRIFLRETPPKLQKIFAVV